MLRARGSEGDAMPASRRMPIEDRYAELGEPAATDAARGTLLVFHRGAWAGEGAGAVRALRPLAERFRGWGWRTLTATYRNGLHGLEDVQATYDYASEQWGSEPIGAYGESSGGHWSLMLALARPRLACVIAAAAPTDLERWSRDVRDPATREFVERTLSDVFGPSCSALSDASPAQRWGGGPRPPLFLLYGQTDPVVPVDQGVEMHARAPGSVLYQLPSGHTPWIHTHVDAGALERDYAALRRELDALR